MNAKARVLVTGFCDWQRTLRGERPADPWACAHNPSGRVLVGDLRATRTEGGEPPPLAGPLVRALARDPRRRHAFALMPVLWGAHGRLPGPPPKPRGAKDEVHVHLGLGVYDRDDVIQLERGAWPWRRGEDAAGRTVDESLVAGPGPARPRLGPAEVTGRIDALAGARVGDFEVRVAKARADNVFLCNETHWHALAAADRGAVQRAYFVHVPHVRGPGDLAALAAALAELIARL